MPSPEEQLEARGLLQENRVSIGPTDGRDYVEIAQFLGYLAEPAEQMPLAEPLEV